MRHRPLLTTSPLRSFIGLLGTLATLGAVCAVVVAGPALATTTPTSTSTSTVTALSRDRGPYWGATQVTVRGTNFDGVQKVLFGHQTAYALRVVSSTKLTVLDPYHGYGTVHVRVVTATGTSVRHAADRFTFTRPTMNTPIMGGLTARQEQRISARMQATHHGVHTARRSKHWTAAMGLTAMRRARSWLGLPYSWAGGNSAGPTRGVCAHNGGDLDCHVAGFDCSGLAMYAWGPYRQLIHYAATQHHQAGRFHPAIGELMPGDLVFFSGYIANGIGHVAVYAGHGTVIEAAQSGTEVMRSQLVDVIAYSGRYRGATRPMSTGRQGTPPSVSSVTTQLPVNGGYLRITGRHLSAATSVSIGGQRVYSFVKRTARHLVVKAPAHSAGRVSVSVSNAWGTAHRSLHYVAAPRIASIATRSSSAGSGRTRVGGTRTARVAPATKADDAFFADRIGDGWYLLGRRQLAR